MPGIPAPPPVTGWTPVWTPAERESFFAAISRHRRSSWRVTVIAAICIGVLAFVVAVLMAPILYALMGLGLDILNLAVPMPDLTRLLMRGLGQAIDLPEAISWRGWTGLLVIAALPGLVLMGLVLAALSRALRAADAADLGAQRIRAPRDTELIEQRFTNVVAEMAVAAAIPGPRVLIAEHESFNAVVLGPDAKHAMLVVSRQLLELLDRDQMQGVAAHLIATIADGDLQAGARVALSLGLFGLLARLTGAIMDRDAARLLPRLLLAAARPDSMRARELLAEISNPFADSIEGRRIPGAPTKNSAASASASPGWREWAAMPFTGPLVLAGFFGGLVATFVLSPLIALAWRQRKYLADSTAVRLTRNPDTLAEALQRMASAGGNASLAPWVAHLAVVRDGESSPGALLSSSPVPMFPAPQRRLLALVRQGATVAVTRPQVPWIVWLVGLPLGALLIGLLTTVIVLLLWLSLALSGLFTLLPFGALNLLLRWLGG